MSDSEVWQAKAALVELAAKERMYRDTGRWRLMEASYYHDSHVRVSWFNGSGHDFVKASSRMVQDGQKWSSGLHLVGPTSVELNGDRAVADTGCTVNRRHFVGDVELDSVLFVRHRSMVERGTDGIWKLRSFRAVYERDQIALVVPGDTVHVDKARLAEYRASYRFLSYFTELEGGVVDSTLPGVDRPDLVDEVIAEDEGWLAGGSYTPRL